MNAPLIPIPPSLERFRDEHGRQLLLVRIKVALLARAGAWIMGRREFFPSGNRVGVQLLARVLELSLENEGHSCLPVGAYVGTLNDCDIVLGVKEIHPPFAAARAEIERLNLGPLAQFGFYDFSTAKWRQLWPEPDGPFKPLRSRI